MVSLLNAIDRETYDVTLWIASPHGVFMPQVPADVKVLTDWRIEALGQNFGGMTKLLCHGCIFLALGSLLRMVLSRVSKAWASRLLAWLMPSIGEAEYDLIVDYNGQQQLYYMVNKLNGKKKVSFFHSDYSKWDYYYSADKKYYAYVDAIFTISQMCVDVLKQYFPQYTDKIGIIENITSPELLAKLSAEPFVSPWRENTLKLISLGHVTDLKGAHWAIEAAHILKEHDVDFQWVFVGLVQDRAKYNTMIMQWGLQDNIIFAGIQANPYTYVKTADILVHPSQFEGKSIALDEAKLLCKPIVVTNFSTVGDQFMNRVNATICEMTPISIADSIEELANDDALRNHYVEYLSEHKVDNTSIIVEIYQLMSE